MGEEIDGIFIHFYRLLLVQEVSFVKEIEALKQCSEMQLFAL
jgi:hypothetical protein